MVKYGARLSADVWWNMVQDKCQCAKKLNIFGYGANKACLWTLNVLWVGRIQGMEFVVVVGTDKFYTEKEKYRNEEMQCIVMQCNKRLDRSP